MYTKPLTIEINLKQVRKGKHYVSHHVQDQRNLKLIHNPAPWCGGWNGDPVSFGSSV